MAEKAEARSDVAALGGGGAVVGDGVEGMVSDGGEAIEVGGVVAPAVTLTASFCPRLQWPEIVQMKKCSPGSERVILTGGLEEKEIGDSPLQLAKLSFVTFATSCL